MLHRLRFLHALENDHCKAYGRLYSIWCDATSDDTVTVASFTLIVSFRLGLRVRDKVRNRVRVRVRVRIKDGVWGSIYL